jgi:CRP/FNR family transcriptional regulator, cyclic AMP receptor protein
MTSTPLGDLAVGDIAAFLAAAGISPRRVKKGPGDAVFEQGADATSVFHLETGAVKLSVLSPTGKEAVIAMLEPGDFFGEGCLAGQRVRMGSATAVTGTTLLRIRKADMVQMLHEQSDFADRFIRHMLARNIRFEQDLVDHLFNSSEKRLARTLLLLAHYGQHETALQVLPKLSQETLAEMIGTTRSRVNFFMNKFRKLGFVEYGSGGVTVKPSLLTVVLHDA